MNNERKEENTDKEEEEEDKQRSKDQKDSPGNTDETTKDLGGNTSSDSVKKVTADSSGSIITTMVAAVPSSSLGTLPVPSSSLGTPPVVKKSPIFDRLSPTSSNFYTPGSDVRKSDAARAGASVSSDSDRYNSLFAMGISRRRKQFPVDSSSSTLDNDVDRAKEDSGSPSLSPRCSSSVLPKLYLYDNSKTENESITGNSRLLRSRPGSDIEVIEEAEEKIDDMDISTEKSHIAMPRGADKVKGLEILKEASESFVSSSGNSSPRTKQSSDSSDSSSENSSSGLNILMMPPLPKHQQEVDRLVADSSKQMASSRMGIDKDGANLILGEALKQIVQTLEPIKRQPDQTGSDESDASSSYSCQNYENESYLEAITGNEFQDSEISHSLYPLPTSGAEKQAMYIIEANFSAPTIEYSSASLDKTSSKKSVYFADSVGLDLTDIHHVSNSQSPPYIPKYVLDKLMLGVDAQPREVSQNFLSPCFDQPGADFNFIKKVLSQKICLENVLVSDMRINGFIRVAKLAPFQSVRVRYSTDGWLSFEEVHATLLSENPDGMTERFSFVIEASPDMQPGSYLELVVLMISSSSEYADYNGGINYKLLCVQKFHS